MKRHPVKPETAKSIAEFVRLVRERENKSTREFAEDLEVVFTYISKVERGIIHEPIRLIDKIRGYLTAKEEEKLIELLMEEK